MTEHDRQVSARRFLGRDLAANLAYRLPPCLLLEAIFELDGCHDGWRPMLDFPRRA